MYIKTVGTRLIAFMIDIIMLFIVGIIFYFLFGFGTLTQTSNGVNFTMNGWEATSVAILYFGLMEYFLKGKTVGKLIFKIQIVDEEFGELNPRIKYLSRALIKGLLIIISPVSFIVVLASKNRQSIHDLIIKSLVIKKVRSDDLVTEESVDKIPEGAEAL